MGSGHIYGLEFNSFLLKVILHLKQRKGVDEDIWCTHFPEDHVINLLDENDEVYETYDGEEYEDVMALVDELKNLIVGDFSSSGPDYSIMDDDEAREASLIMDRMNNKYRWTTYKECGTTRMDLSTIFDYLEYDNNEFVRSITDSMSDNLERLINNEQDEQNLVDVFDKYIDEIDWAEEQVWT